MHEISVALFAQYNMYGQLLLVIYREYLVGDNIRTYILMKREYKAEYYSLLRLPLKHRSAVGTFCCGVAPIRIETGRSTCFLWSVYFSSYKIC